MDAGAPGLDAFEDEIVAMFRAEWRLARGDAPLPVMDVFAAGVLLVIFRPLRVGEYVDLGGVAGTVDQVQIFSTTLRTSDNKTIVVKYGGHAMGEGVPTEFAQDVVLMKQTGMNPVVVHGGTVELCELPKS